MAKHDWSAIEQEFVTGIDSLADLARKYSIVESTMRMRAKRDGWQEKRDEWRRNVTQTAQAESADTRIQQLKDWNEEDLRLARKLREQIEATLDSTNPLPAKDARALAAAAAEVQKIGRLALGATTENTGHSAPGGGPVEVATSEFTTEQLAAYSAAREQLLKDF